MKCRLCLCFVDKQMGYSSLLDNGFNNMIQQVLCFAMATDNTIPGQQSNMPMMVCNQCFTTVRNFYSFSKMVEANQKTLRSECTEQNVSMSIDEFVRSIKLENSLEHNATNGIANNTLLMATEVEPIRGGKNIPSAPQGQAERMCVPTEVRTTCIDRVQLPQNRNLSLSIRSWLIKNI
uniref:ZAD domain-containing protein n=1 Tax=Anopheles atroparvus TaxID=41427 RepID=A0AAG5DDF5_ANOAO